MAVVSLICLLLIVLAAIFASSLAPYPDHGRGVPNPADKFLPPSNQYLLGTDQLGRDVLSRLIFGARTSLLYGFAVVATAMAIGATLGAVAGYFGGLIDELIMAITDIFLAFPPLLLAIVIASVLDRGIGAAILALALTWWPWYTRIVRGQTLSLRERDFVRAARNIGVADLTIVRRHILPNVFTPVLVQGTLDLGAAILTAAGLSFLGLGTQPPVADWGVMISDGRSYLLSGFWWIATVAGLAIFLITLLFNLLGDGVQVALDPHQRGG
jgi:peptide/nickel transport system permease protein